MVALSVPTLYTPRLTLRVLGDADHAPLLALAHDPAVSRYLHEGPPPTLSDIAQRVAGSHRQWALRRYGMMGVEDADGFVGRLGAYHPPDAADPLLAYALNRRGWGLGYATEGVRAFLHWLRANHGPMTLLAHVDPRNDGSARVMAKLGGLRSGAVTQGGAALDVWRLDV